MPAEPRYPVGASRSDAQCIGMGWFLARERMNGAMARCALTKILSRLFRIAAVWSVFLLPAAVMAKDAAVP